MKITGEIEDVEFREAAAVPGPAMARFAKGKPLSGLDINDARDYINRFTSTTMRSRRGVPRQRDRRGG